VPECGGVFYHKGFMAKPRTKVRVHKGPQAECQVCKPQLVGIEEAFRLAAEKKK